MRRLVVTCAAGLVGLGIVSCQAATDAWTKLTSDAPVSAAQTPTVATAPAKPETPTKLEPTTPEPTAVVKQIEPPKPPDPAKAPEPARPWATPAAESAAFELAAARVTADLLRKNVEALAADDMNGRPTPSPELERAAQVIASEFGRLALEVPSRAPEYRQRFECGAPGAGESSNVVGLFPGFDVALAEQFIIVSAHYDHLGISDTPDTGDDTIFNGANDDASGVAAMIAIAEVLHALPNRPRRSVLFVGFCGEERGLRGSSHYAEDPVVPHGSTVAHLNLEMLGRPGETTPTRAWMTGSKLSTLGEALVTVGAEAGIEFVDGEVVGATEGNLFERSDNYPLARAGVVAHSISTGRLDEFYHHVDDEIALLEYERMVPIVRALARVVWRLAQDDAKPQWTAAGTAAGFAPPGRWD